MEQPMVFSVRTAKLSSCYYVQGRGRTESGSSAVSESGSGVLEPPPTPEGSSLASIQAASALYSSSLNDRIAPSFKGGRARVPGPSILISSHSCRGM